MQKYKTEQEEFWAGDFGNNYIERNKDATLLASNINLFSKIFSKTFGVNSVMEFGANIGMNLIAIKKILPFTKLYGIEINEKAYDKLKNIDYVSAFHSSILDFDIEVKADFVFTKGVLIHINPEELKNVYKKIYEASDKYICIIEYYNPVPVSIDYRGHKNRLFKRDFAGDFLKNFSGLKLIDYGFIYHNDNNFPQDDINWFLLKKRGSYA